MQDKDKLIDLVQRYQVAKSAGQLENSSEATMRTWIDELLSVFGWDVQNTQQVLTEHTLGRSEKEKLCDIGSTNTRPDYTLVNGSVMLTFVDAKSLAVNIESDKDAAFQIRSYGWSIGAPFSIITNFEQLAIYDCSVMPSVFDEADYARIHFYEYSQFVEKYDTLKVYLSRENIIGGTIRFVRGKGNALDEKFSRLLGDVRKELAKAILDKNDIKNGIATLANDVFIFRPVRFDNLYNYLIKDGKEYPIEKGICRDIIKPNVLKTEEEIPEKEEKIISPYDSEHNLIKEDFFLQEYPLAYRYLQTYRIILDARDKREGDYGAWYAFGRTQAIADNGLKLLFPYMSDLPHFVYMPKKDMLIYCGYAIYNDSETELLFLKRVLESSVFDYYMKNTSKPYSTGYYSYAKNYVKSFGIYPFSEEQKQHILSIQTKDEIDDYIRKAYRVSI